MNTTTSAPSSSSTAGNNSLEQFYAYFSNPPVVIRFYQIGFTFTFLLGFTGNTASLLTFSRPALRKISTGWLFIILAVSDTLYLFIAFFDYLEFGFAVPFYRRIAYSELCRFRFFMMNVAQVGSAWILVLISIDRWIRTRFPFKSAAVCTPKNALIATVVLLLIDVGLHAHMLTTMAGTLIPGFANGACGPDLQNKEYLAFYYLVWNSIQIFVNCLVPAFFMFVILADICIVVRFHKRVVIRPDQARAQDQRQSHAQKQMFILMLASIGVFLITNLPLAIGKITLPRNNVFNEALSRTTIYTGLGWFQSLNYALNFYLHCLSSTLFRSEFKQQMQCCSRHRRARANVLTRVRQTGF